MNLPLVPPATRVQSSGDGQPLDVSSSKSRTFLVTLNISETIEQQSLDLSIFGSPDGAEWTPKPLLKIPQRFYRGETRLVLDLTPRPELKFIRARWDLNRWGRVAPTPDFTLGVALEEVPAMPHTMAPVAAHS